MTVARVAETSVTFNNNSPFEDYVHQDDQTQPTFEMTPGFNLSQKCLITSQKESNVQYNQAADGEIAVFPKNVSSVCK